jgi:hypothetical protein
MTRCGTCKHLDAPDYRRDIPSNERFPCRGFDAPEPLPKSVIVRFMPIWDDRPCSAWAAMESGNGS